MPKVPLPIDALLPEIVRAVQSNPITLLQAEPGAGKTTRVPAALLAAGLQKTYVLEPRRLAARLAAKRVAFELGEPLGESVGYRVRFEEVGNSRTSLWYLTEGVLVRSLIGQRNVRDVRVVVLDEFHERHLETDVAFALLRHLQNAGQDVRLLLMSATLHANELRSRLKNAAYIEAPGNVFPVTVEYTPTSSEPLPQQVHHALERTLPSTSGHILVFLPGVAEIRATIDACRNLSRQANASLLPLHGELAPEEQERAVAPGKERKIICSTNVAESSVTIDGVSAVIDSGLARIKIHSPWSGFPRLNVQRISKASAIQRAGRAGRTGPGVAIRLYSEAEFVRRPDDLPPEILRSELSDLLLSLAVHGLNVVDLPWLDAPPEAHVTEAFALLVRLQALDQNGKSTALGRRIAELGVHPRVARFVLRANELHAGREACDLAARLSEGRMPRADLSLAAFSSDIEVLLSTRLSHGAQLLRSRLLRQLAPAKTSATSTGDALEKALLFAYGDRVASKRGDHLLLCSGGSARLSAQSLVHSKFLLAIDVEDRAEQTLPIVRFASHIEPDWLLEVFPERVHARDEMRWNRTEERVEQVNMLLYEALVLDETCARPTDAVRASQLLVSKALEAGITRFADVASLEQVLQRATFAARHSATTIPADVVGLALEEVASGLTSFAELRSASANGRFLSAVEAILPMGQINAIAPTHFQLPSGRRAKIEYYPDHPPSIASRLQDFFGLRQTPVIANGAVRLTVQLLAPNQRPVQVTTDLSSFWKNLYPQLRKQLSRRYPKHFWPESPEQK